MEFVHELHLRPALRLYPHSKGFPKGQSDCLVSLKGDSDCTDSSVCTSDASTWQVSTDGLISIHLTSKCRGTCVCLGVYLRVYLWFEVDIDLSVTGAPLNPEMTLSFTCCRCTSWSWVWPRSVSYWPPCCGELQLQSACHDQTGGQASEGTQMINNFAKQNLCAGKLDISDRSITALWGTKYAIKEGVVLYAQLYNLLLPYFRNLPE